jgi:membrane peptidoglycan carboxypeptidase
LEKLVLALEDRRFMRHAGVDVQSVIREVVRALMFRRHGGASTIDMQFVRTATGYKDKTLCRKAYEVILAIIIQYRYSKILILRSYLNRAFFGSRLIGADKAAMEMFGLSAVDLNLDQAATLAAMLVYPKPLAGGSDWSAKVGRRAAYGKAIYFANKKGFDQLPG